MFFGIAVATVGLVIELIRRRKPERLLESLSSRVRPLRGRLRIYRYLPRSRWRAGGVISLVLLYRLRPALTVLAVARVCSGLDLRPRTEARSSQAFGPSYFAVPAGAFSDLKDAGSSWPGRAARLPRPYLPESTELVRAGGNLDGS